MDRVFMLPKHHTTSSSVGVTTCCPPHTLSPRRTTSTFWPALLHYRVPPSLKCRAAAEPQRGKKYEKTTLPDFFEVDRDATAFDLIFESAQALKTARHYEVVFLVHEDHVGELQDVIQKVKDFIEEKKGKIFRLNDWGLRKLAYKINKAKRANYILMNFQIGGEEINEFKSLLDKDERIIRHLVITMKQAETAETVPPPEFSSIKDVDDDDSDEEYDESEDEDVEVEEAEEETLATG
eukprot:c39948_g1_i1 orf=761-1471(-)